MQASMFNVRVPLPAGDEVFLMNTFSDAQLIVSSSVADLLDRLPASPTPGGLEQSSLNPAGLDQSGLSLAGLDQSGLNEAERAAIGELAQHGFVVSDRESERRSLDQFFTDFWEDRSQLRVTVLTTLQCNFACDYCFQGDHGDYNKHAAKMTLETAGRVAEWMEARLDEVEPEKFVLTFFGGEPLLNLPVMYDLAERTWRASQARGVKMLVNIITNGLLLTPEVVDRLAPYGLNGVKITLDGDRATHNRMRPLRGGQGTFDRIVGNIRRIAGRCAISIGGNFDESSADSYPALLDFLKEQEFADKLAKVAFKPIFRQKAPAPLKGMKGLIPLTAVNAGGKPLNGTCMTSAGAGGSTPCDTCHFADEKMSFLREETKKRGFPTMDGVHMGPCEIHKRHAHTIGPDGSLYACPGFTGEASLSTGHIDGRREAWRETSAKRFDKIAAWRQCGDCSFIPVCAGGCSVASHAELGDMNTPTCHKRSFESAVISLAEEAASAA